MIIISKSKLKGYFVTYKAANGEALSHSEILNTKQSVKKNIIAMAKLFGVDTKVLIKVKDKTGPKVKITHI